jgi:transposase
MLGIVMQEKNSDEFSVERLGHHGLVAAVIKELGIDQKIDARLPIVKEKGAIVPHGQRVAAMVLNGLGFVNQSLYLSPHFFEDKPMSLLLDEGIEAEHLNDDCLGRCLDKIAEYGTTKLFSEVMFEVVTEQGLLSKNLRTDTTNFSLYGDYDAAPNGIMPTPNYGHSKSHRYDLKQVTLSLTQMGEANIPVWMEALDGNSSDKKNFQETVRKIQAFTDELKGGPEHLFFVLDSAFYVPAKLAELTNIGWITRVPAILKEAKTWLNDTSDNLLWEQYDAHYKISAMSKNISGHEQRWILVESELGKAQQLKTFYKKIHKDYETIEKKLWHFCNKIFNCESDAEHAMSVFCKGLKYHGVEYQLKPILQHQTKGRPKLGEEKVCVGYSVVGHLYFDLEKIARAKMSLGRFILATNELDQLKLSNKAILNEYKGQTHIEGGFRFIKDPRFSVDSFFLKTPKRIGALMMVMTLCLVVYNYAQYQLRESLKKQDDVVPNQLGKPVKNPTARWIFQLMATISVICQQNENGIKTRRIANLKTIHKIIIFHFGKHAKKIYGISTDFQIPTYDRNQKNLLKWCGM